MINYCYNISSELCIIKVLGTMPIQFQIKSRGFKEVNGVHLQHIEFSLNSFTEVIHLQKSADR